MVTPKQVQGNFTSCLFDSATIILYGPDGQYVTPDHFSALAQNFDREAEWRADHRTADERHTAFEGLLGGKPSKKFIA